jgi:hypothetical protein
MGETLYQILGRHRAAPLPARKPSWLKVRAPGGPNYLRLKALMRELDLHTVCEEAHCPNVGECWEHGTATFMILGDVCTRNCAYCAVAHGRPARFDPAEPARVARRQVRVVLAGQPPPGGLDRCLAGAALDAEHVVRVPDGHPRSLTTRPPCSTAAQRSLRRA